MNWLSFYLRSFLTMLLLGLVATSAFAQLGTTGINGYVRDPSETSIKGAIIRVTNTDTNQTYETSSNAEGFFAVLNLKPGNYKVSIQADGFDMVTFENVNILVGNIATILAKTSIVKTKDIVEVVADRAKSVNLVSSGASGVVNKSSIENLPLNGRNFLDLSLLLPGTAPGGVFETLKIGVSSQNTVVGQTARSSNISVDGADNNDELFGVGLQNLPIDSVQEFQIAQTGFSAEFGRATGGVINVVTKSGTNEYHGSSAVFFRSDKFSALPATLDRNIVNRLGEPPFDRQQYALSFGGRIKKDKAWFFSSYEYRFQDSIAIVGVRDLNMRRINTSYAPTFLRNPLLLTRADTQVSANDRMSLRFAFERNRTSTTPLSIAGLQTANSLVTPVDRYYSINYNWVHTFSPNLVNDFLFQQGHSSNNLPATNNQPQILYPSLQEGNSFDTPQSTSQNKVQFRNNLSLILGNHTIKFGGEFQQINSDFSLASFGDGVIIVSENFATVDRNRDGKVDDLDITIIETRRSFNNSAVSTPSQFFAGFFQDSWKIRRNFTFNFGLRYEIDTNATNRKDFSQLPPVLQRFGRPKIDKNNFAPRIGFNWDPFGDGKTSIRANYGIYYNRNLLQFANSTSGSSSNLLFEIRSGSEVDDNGFFIPGTPTLLSNTFSGDLILIESASLSLVEPNFATPYVQQFNFGVEREIARDLVFTAEAIHNFGVKFAEPRVNLIGDTPVTFFSSRLKNWYDGLFLRLEKKPSSFYSFLASYTFSKALNLSEDDFLIDFDPNSTQETKKGPAFNDMRHRFVMSGVVKLPLGLNLSSILTVESAVPVPIFLPDFVPLPFAQRGAGARQFDTGAELNEFIRQINVGLDEPIPFVRDDIKFGNNFVSMDLRLAKNFKIGEKATLQGIVEVFNIFNKTNIRNIDVLSFHGLDNVIVRDSGDRNDPGFLRSSNFGAKLQTAGGVFGTGGPRALQLAVRFQF